MRRVVVTGMGIVSSIGNNTQEVLASLREAKSGIRRAEEYAKLGFRCQVQGMPTLDPADVGRPARHALPRRRRGLEPRRHGAGDPRFRRRGERHFQPRTGIVMGSGGPSTRSDRRGRRHHARERVPKRVGPFAVPKAMSSTASATLATWFKIKGVNYSISSACATSNHCIGNATEMIQWGKQDMMFAGGCEELDWTLSVLFDAMGAMSSKYNDTPAEGLARLRHGPRRLRHRRRRRRAGAGRARARQGARRQDLCRGRRLWRDLRRLRHGGALGRGRGALHEDGARRPARRRSTTSIRTPPRRRSAISRRSRRSASVFGAKCPPISATKSLTGHSLGAAGAQEAIYSLLMMHNGFICESANIENLDPAFADMPIVRERKDNVTLGACCRTRSASAAPMRRWCSSGWTCSLAAPEGAPVASERVERRLTAILAGDVVGYSRLMGADEEGTLARAQCPSPRVLSSRRSPNIAAASSRRTGDGILIEFAQRGRRRATAPWKFSAAWSSATPALPQDQPHRVPHGHSCRRHHHRRRRHFRRRREHRRAA